MTFMEKLSAAWKKNNSLVCVGLDPDLKKMPECVTSRKYPIFEFNKAIVDATASDVCCYKPQAAYYAGQDADDQLLMTMEYLRKNYPEIPVILDAKRADIGNTTQMYALEAFGRYGADAVTVNPYMGMDALKPFLDYADKGVVVLCRTSNKGAKEIQELKLENGMELYKHVAALISGPWNYNGNTMLVAGATFPQELGEIRRIVGPTPLLVPGIGAQGGDMCPVGAAAAAKDPDAQRQIVRHLRGKLFRRCGEKCFAGLLADVGSGVWLIGRIIQPLFGVFIKCRIRGHSLF